MGEGVKIYTLHNIPDPEMNIKPRKERLEWLGHMIKINKTRVAKNIFKSNTARRRKVGRSKLRWQEDTVTCRQYGMC
jgi:hypothetical protein